MNNLPLVLENLIFEYKVQLDISDIHERITKKYPCKDGLSLEDFYKLKVKKGYVKLKIKKLKKN